MFGSHFRNKRNRSRNCRAYIYVKGRFLFVDSMTDAQFRYVGRLHRMEILDTFDLEHYQSLGEEEEARCASSQ